ncbi:MAG: glycosyltransferase [Planctomycetota bacterium]|nr:glycosyltransferase [Planctomycetota bacterium]
MNPVSVVIPAFEARAQLAANLPALLHELEQRALGDEVIVVDDGGLDGLEAWISATFPPPATFDSARADVRVLRRKKNAGPERAALDGARAAGHAHVLLLAPDVQVRAGFLAPLCAALEDPIVAAASPRIVGADGRGLPRLVWRGGMLEIEPGEADGTDGDPADAAYASSSAMLVRRDELLAAGFDARFTPGELADVDLSWTWKKSGRRVVTVPRSVVVRSAGPNGGLSPELAGSLAIRNRLLLTWKHLDAPERRREHVEALEARALDALLAGRADELAVLAIALDT